MTLSLEEALEIVIEPAISCYVSNTSQPTLREALQVVLAWIEDRERNGITNVERAMLEAWMARDPGGPRQ
jgi:hypothetical protein